MHRLKSPHYLAAALIVLFLLIAVNCLSSISGAGEKENGDPGIVTIDIPSVEDHDAMPGVQFQHALHNTAVEKDCSLCHMEEDEKRIFKFKRTEKLKPDTLLTLYHENCITCHVDKKEQGGGYGPMAGECRACHNAEPELKPRRSEVKFDRSLHFRHTKSDEIKPLSDSQEQNCSACHHQYNRETEKIYYEKGKEGACIYCHKEEKTEEARPIKQAAHDSCIACHQKFKEEGVKKAGPVTCAACHGKEAFKGIKKMEDVPRLKRNQPDTVLITGWESMDLSPRELEKIENRFMKPVAFHHKSHETNADSCKDCHHASLEKCSSCHTPAGGEKGEHVRLDQAMHSKDSARSCMGCHEKQKQKPECAGCHFSMPDNEFSESSCKKCHQGEIKAGGFSLLDKETKTEMARMVLQDKADTFTPVKESRIPETVTIDELSKEYEPSEFPHRKVVSAITKKIEESELAGVFHSDGKTLCMGCHHNSPPSLTSPACASCHGESTFAANGRPGLKGAYHGQCITCHQQMKMEKVEATDCIKCHKEKKKEL